MRRRILASGLFLPAIAAATALGAGCGGGVSGSPNADARVGGDGPPRVDGGAGDRDGPPSTAQELVLQFSPKERLPGDLGGTWDAHVTRARLVLADLVVVGDTAPGDDRTRLASVSLLWSAEETRDDAHLPEAPLGRYSRIEARFATIELDGTLGADIDGPFHVELTPTSGWTFAFSFEPVTLAAGVDATIDVEVDVRRLIDAVDWANVDDEDGTRVVESGSDAAADMAREADEVFEVED